MNNDKNCFELHINIEPSDIDQLGHVNNVVYVRWIQEVAAAHWYSQASQEDQKNLLWVVVRHEIDYKQPAFLGDKIIARTWVGSASRHAFERHTELIRASDSCVLARALTVWCPINARTGKPTEVSAQVRTRFSVTE